MNKQGLLKAMLDKGDLKIVLGLFAHCILKVCSYFEAAMCPVFFSFIIITVIG